jgi:hypothetical protein
VDTKLARVRVGLCSGRAALLACVHPVISGSGPPLGSDFRIPGLALPDVKPLGIWRSSSRVPRRTAVSSPSRPVATTTGDYQAKSQFTRLSPDSLRIHIVMIDASKTARLRDFETVEYRAA